MSNLRSSDYYQILGVSRSASDAELKKAYRKLSIKVRLMKQTRAETSARMIGERVGGYASYVSSVLQLRQMRLAPSIIRPDARVSRSTRMKKINEWHTSVVVNLTHFSTVNALFCYKLVHTYSGTQTRTLETSKRPRTSRKFQKPMRSYPTRRSERSTISMERKE